MSVSYLFQTFLNNLAVKNRSEISKRYNEITKVLNQNFRNSSSETDNCFQIGSFGRNTAIDGISDLDMLYILPDDIKKDYCNDDEGPRKILSRVRDAIVARYPRTEIRVDQCIVSVSYTNFHIEVQPVFENADKSFSYPDTYAKSWKITKPRDEITALNETDKVKNGVLKNLCKMTRAWKNKSGVVMGGLLIDTLAYNFLNSVDLYDLATISDYPELCKDFFKFLSNEPLKQYYLALGSNQQVKVKKPFQKKSKRAFNMCIEALNAQNENEQAQKWRDIFGKRFPKSSEVLREENYSLDESVYNHTEEYIEDIYPVDIRYNLEIDCKVTQAGFRTDTLRNMLFRKMPLKACKDLLFFITVNEVPAPYEIKWKVLNRGEEAKKRNMIRGQIESDGGHKTKKEHTDFMGNHIVECYIIKDNVVVARDFIDVPITTNRNDSEVLK